MNNSSPKLIAAVTLLLIGMAFWPAAPVASSSKALAGGIGIANEQSETVFTASPDGKTIYMWQYYSSKPPKFLGKSEAILQVK